MSYFSQALRHKFSIAAVIVSPPPGKVTSETFRKLIIKRLGKRRSEDVQRVYVLL